VLFVQADGPARRAQSVSRVSGGGLRWTLASRANQSGGTAEIWQAYAPAKLKKVAVTATLARRGDIGSLTLVSFNGAGRHVGATAKASGATGRPTLSLRPTSCNSFLWASGHDPDHATTPRGGKGQVIVHSFASRKARDTEWVQRVTGPTTAGKLVTISDTKRAGDHWQLAAAEIKPT
jgi:hypothetical protein